MIGGEAEVRVRLHGRVRDVEAEVVLRPHHGRSSRADDLARIHAVGRVPQRLELAEGLHQLRPKHLFEESATRLAVAVLAGERAAERDDQVRCAVDELAIVGDALRRAEVEVDALMHATLAEVAVER